MSVPYLVGRVEVCHVHVLEERAADATEEAGVCGLRSERLARAGIAL